MEHSAKQLILGSGLSGILFLTGCNWAAHDDYYEPHNHSGVQVQQVPQAYATKPAVPLFRQSPVSVPAQAPPAPAYTPRAQPPATLVPPPAPAVPIVPQSYQYLPHAYSPQAWGQRQVNWQPVNPFPAVVQNHSPALADTRLPEFVTAPQEERFNPFTTSAQIAMAAAPEVNHEVVPEIPQEQTVSAEPRLLESTDTNAAALLPSINPR